MPEPYVSAKWSAADTRRTGLTNGMTSSSRTYEEGLVLLVLNIFNVRRPGNLFCDEVLGYLRL